MCRFNSFILTTVTGFEVVQGLDGEAAGVVVVWYVHETSAKRRVHNQVSNGYKCQGFTKQRLATVLPPEGNKRLHDDIFCLLKNRTYNYMHLFW